MVGTPRCPSVGASRQPDVARRLLVRQLKPATRLLPDVCPRAGTVERALLAVTAGVRAPLLSLTARAADVSLRLPPSRWLLAGARPPPGPSPRSPAPADRLLRGAPGAGSVSFDPEAGVVTGLTRDRDSRSENRCSMCSAIHISSRTSPSCCLYRPTPFVGSDERRVGRLSPAFGSSRIASPAYQEWPTRHSHSRPHSS